MHTGKRKAESMHSRKPQKSSIFLTGGNLIVGRPGGERCPCLADDFEETRLQHWRFDAVFRFLRDKLGVIHIDFG